MIIVILFFNNHKFVSGLEKLIAIQNFAFGGCVDDDRVVGGVDVVRLVQPDLVGDDRVGHDHVAAGVRRHVLRVDVGVLGPRLEEDEDFVLEADCLHSARVLAFCQLGEPLYALVRQLLPLPAEREEAPFFLRSVRDHRLFQVFRGLHEPDISWTVVVVADLRGVQWARLVFTRENQDVPRLVVDNARSSELGVSPVVVGPLVVLGRFRRDLRVGEIGDSCRTLGLLPVLCFEAVHVLESYGVRVEGPMVDGARVVVTQVHPHETASYFRN